MSALSETYLRALADVWGPHGGPGSALPALRDATHALTGRGLLEAVEGERSLATSAGVRAGDVVAVTGTPVECVVRSLAARAAEGISCLLARDVRTPAIAAWRWSSEDGLVRVGSTPPGAVPEGTTWLRPTGGTTTTTRLVAFTDEQCLEVARLAGQVPEIRRGDVVVTTLFPSTSFGWNSSTFGPLLAGGHVVYAGAATPRALFEAHDGPVAWRAATAPVVRALARLDVPRARTNGWRVMIAGGAYPTEEAARLLAEKGVGLYDRYGATEFGVGGQAREPLGPLFPIPGVGVHGVGEPPLLEVRTAPGAMALGYVGEPGSHPEPLRGVLRTADRIEMAADGTFRVLGRGDRIVKRAGRAIDLGTIERRIAGLPGVARARVRSSIVGLDVDLVATVVRREGAVLDPTVLLEAAAEALEPWERPTRIEVLDRDPQVGAEKWTEAPLP